MARLASQSKGGYYPTPPREMELLLKNFVRVNAGTSVNVLDPCAGEGDALKQIGDYLDSLGAVTETYGVELEKGRAELAKTKASKVLAGGYEWLRATNNAFNLIYLNPPYDTTHLGERMENVFFRDLTAPDKYTQPNALVVVCVPQYVLKDMANLLSLRLENIQVVRFTDANYPNFKQVFVLGYRRKGRPLGSVTNTKKWLETLSDVNPTALPTVEDAEEGLTFLLPERQNEVQLFRGSLLDEDEVAQDIDNSSLFSQIGNIILPDSSGIQLKRPLLPLKVTQYALAIASGSIGGNLGGHIIQGVTKQIADTKSEYDEEKKEEKITEIMRFITTVRVFSPEGVFDLD